MRPTGAEQTMKTHQFCNNSATTEQLLFFTDTCSAFPYNIGQKTEEMIVQYFGHRFEPRPNDDL
jgi:hypothetical protein